MLVVGRSGVVDSERAWPAGRWTERVGRRGGFLRDLPERGDPERGVGCRRLLGVAATSSNNAWTVGYHGNRALIEHWNGKTWTVQASPKLRSSQLSGVAATSPRNAWAVGHVGESALIEHWNGKAWTIQATPQLRSSQLSGVAATSPRNAWAVGHVGESALIEHWNGKAWTIQATPQLRSSQLLRVAATSSDNASVGYTSSVDSFGDEATRTLIVDWSGKTWTVQASPTRPDSTAASS